jgi:succinate-semialdehyde dehydrogenase/glutarate-semialdehyde dehydrogenase
MKKDNLFKSKAFINGEWTNSASGETFEVKNPATGELLGVVPDMNREDVARAIDAADTAWPAYRSITAKERSAIMRNWFNLLMENKEAL